MDLRKLKKLIDLVEESGITELEVTEGEEKVRIVKQPAGALHPTYMMQAAPVAAAASSAEQPPTTAAGTSATPGEGQIVRSPMVGTFYRAARPDTDPFVEMGSVVKSGDTLCILEALKLPDEFVSEYAGTITAILVENGQPVEYGEPLFIID